MLFGADHATVSLKFCVSEGRLALCEGGQSFDALAEASGIIEPLARALSGRKAWNRLATRPQTSSRTDFNRHHAVRPATRTL